MSLLFSPSLSLQRSASCGHQQVSSPSAFFLTTPPPANHMLMEEADLAVAHAGESLLLVSPEPVVTSSSTSTSVLRFAAGPPPPARLSSNLASFGFAAATSAAVTAGAAGWMPLSSNKSGFPSSSALPSFQTVVARSDSSLQFVHHHNPALLDGFLLDGGSAVSAAAAAAAALATSKDLVFSASNTRNKRKASQQAEEEHSAKRSKSLSSSSSSVEKDEVDLSRCVLGKVSPLLELLQQGNNNNNNNSHNSNVCSNANVEGSVAALPQFSNAAVPSKQKSSSLSKEERRKKAAAKMQRVEARIARLTAAMSQTRAQEEQATMLAQYMAEQAMQAAVAAAAAQQTQQVVGLANSFLAVVPEMEMEQPSSLSVHVERVLSSSSEPSTYTSSLPSLSPTVTPSGPNRALSVSAASSSTADELENNQSGVSSPSQYGAHHCIGPMDMGSASPVRSLDEYIDAALQHQSERGEVSEAAVRTLHWAEQAHHLRTLQRTLCALEAEIDQPTTTIMDGVASFPLALRFLEEEGQKHDGRQDNARAALLRIMEEEEASCANNVESDDFVSTDQLHASMHELTVQLLAKSRAQQGAFRLMV